MNPFLSSSTERIKSWKNIRQSLTSDLSDETHFRIILDYFKYAPELSSYIDVDNPNSWPSPWDLIYTCNLCRDGIGYLIEQTLFYSNCNRWTTDRVELVYLKDVKYSKMNLMVLIDKKIVLNYNHSDYILWDTIEKDSIILNRYEYNENTKKHRII